MCTTKTYFYTYKHILVFNEITYTLNFVKAVRSGVDVLENDGLGMLLAYRDNAFAMFRYDTYGICTCWHRLARAMGRGQSRR